MNMTDVGVLVRESARLRGERRFAEAVALVEGRLDGLSVECRPSAYLEIFYAAREGGDKEKALEYASKLDQEIPSVKQFMARL
jgi:hypothetical protein